ncbi:MAG TPA: peptidyl-prolyl cis-trans isomerase [Thermoleophilaceae bacterium]|nr:peptidyl-prolyl cis-trans isomerase [Thermoleophilaceae bacterium]
MTHAFKKSILALAAAALGAAAFAGCGNDVPAGAVAKVGDATITQDEFDKWLATAAKGNAQGATAAVPDPPDYTKCVAAKSKTPVPKGQKKTSNDALKKQCKSEYDALKKEVMQFLIQAEWVQQEAADKGIKVTDAQIRKSFADQKKQAFPNDKQYKQFLASSGMTEDDILFRVRLDQLQQKLTQKVTEDAKKVSDADISAYYDKNKKRFAQPERRDLRVVLTKTEAKANQAKQALASGQSFKKVVKQYSIDEASKSQAGLLPAVSEGQQEKAFDKAIFDAQKGKLEGPVKTQFGWYVFKVEKVTKASQQTLEQSKETIKNLLRSQRQQKALDAFIKSFREDYKDRTDCADDYRVAECKNAPKDETDTGPASGGNPGAQPQQPAAPAPTPTPPQSPQSPPQQP